MPLIALLLAAALQIAATAQAYTAASPALKLSAASLSLGSVTVDYQSTQWLVATNVGNVPLSLTSATIVGDVG